MGAIYRLFKYGGLVGLYLATVALMYQDTLRDPYDPSRQGTEAYGHNGPDTLQQMSLICLVELAVLYLILRPWSFQRSPRRVLTGLALFLPWTFFSMLICMHAGGIVTLHFLWLGAVNLVLVGLLLVSLFSPLRDETELGSRGEEILDKS